MPDTHEESLSSSGRRWDTGATVTSIQQEAAVPEDQQLPEDHIAPGQDRPSRRTQSGSELAARPAATRGLLASRRRKLAPTVTQCSNEQTNAKTQCLLRALSWGRLYF